MSSDNGRRKSKLLCVEAVCKTVENSFGTIYNLKNCCTCEDLLQHCPKGRVYELLRRVLRLQDDCNKFIIMHKIVHLL